MSYLVNGTNIAPVAYGHCSSTGVGSNLYNCTATGSHPYTVTLLSGTYTTLIPIASFPHSGINGSATATSNTVTFSTHAITNANNNTADFYFVIFGH